MNPQPIGLFYRDNVAIIDISIAAWSSKDADLSALIQNCREATYEIYDESGKLVFDRTYLDVQQHLKLGITTAGVYELVLTLKDCYGQVQAFKRTLNIVELQANFVIAIADNKRHSLEQSYAGNSLSQIAAKLQEPDESIDIAGMNNATLYYSTRKALGVPDFMSYPDPNVFDPENVKKDDSIIKWLYNLDKAQSNVLWLDRLNDIKLIDSDCMQLLQYGSTYLNMQIDIEDAGAFAMSMSEFVDVNGIQVDADEVNIAYADVKDLLKQINDYCELQADSQFAKFTWSVQEIQMLDNSMQWALYAYSKEPISRAQLHVNTDLHFAFDDFELTGNWPATIIADVVDTTEHDVEIHTNDKHYTLHIANTQLVEELEKLGLHCKLVSEESQKPRYLIESPWQTLSIKSDMFECQHHYAVQRRPNDTRFCKIDNGATVTVGSQVCCFPDELSYAYAPHDIKWTCTYRNAISGGVIEATSDKYLFRHHFRHIGDYDIELAIINPRNGKVIKRINKAVSVTKG